MIMITSRGSWVVLHDIIGSTRQKSLTRMASGSGIRHLVVTGYDTVV